MKGFARADATHGRAGSGATVPGAPEQQLELG